MADGQAEPDAGPRVFISYRRDDAAAHAGRLYDALIDRFGADRVFMDVDSIQVGADFTHVVEEAIEHCDAVVAVMGPSWLTATDSKGRRRLDNPDDLVRLELEIALERNARILPVLVEGADMPASDELPPSLSALVRRHAFDIADRRWRSDILELISALEGLARQNQAAIDAQARLEAAEEQARLEAEEQARLEAEEQARLEAEEQARLKADERARLEADLPARRETEEQARRKADDLPAPSAPVTSTRGRWTVLIAGSFLILDLLFLPWQRIEGYASTTGIEDPESLPGVLAFLITLAVVGEIIWTMSARSSADPVVVGPETLRGAKAPHFWTRWRHLLTGVAVFALLLVKFVLAIGNTAVEASGALKLGADGMRLIVAIEDPVGASSGGSLEPGAYLGLLLAAAVAFGGFFLDRASAGRRPRP